MAWLGALCFWASPGAVGQGALTNGLSLEATLAVGATNSHALTANAGDGLVLQIAKTAGGAGFTPRFEVFGPDDVSLGVTAHGTAARMDLQADLDGTYTVLVSDQSGTGSGTYQLGLAQVPGEFETAVGDESGELLNGSSHQGAITVGTLIFGPSTPARAIGSWCNWGN